jgi:hypothetical protein
MKLSPTEIFEGKIFFISGKNDIEQKRENYNAPLVNNQIVQCERLNLTELVENYV